MPYGRLTAPEQVASSYPFPFSVGALELLIEKYFLKFKNHPTHLTIGLNLHEIDAQRFSRWVDRKFIIARDMYMPDNGWKISGEKGEIESGPR